MNNFELMKKQLPVNPMNIGGVELQQTVIGRDLHNGLGIAKDYTDWCKVQVTRANLIQGIDYEIFNQSVVFPQQGENLRGGRPSKEYVFTVSAAKKIAMMSETIKGDDLRSKL